VSVKVVAAHCAHDPAAARNYAGGLKTNTNAATVIGQLWKTILARS
jgi:hypothetical protein